MKHLVLTLALLGIFAASAMAEEVVRQLPGNATIVTNTDRPTRGVTILNTDKNVYYRALFGRERQRDYYKANPSAASGVQAQCAQENRSSSSQNACVRRALREYEHGVND